MHKEALKQAIDRLKAIIDLYEDARKPFDARCYVAGALGTEISEVKAELPSLCAALAAVQPETAETVSDEVAPGQGPDAEVLDREWTAYAIRTGLQEDRFTTTKWQTAQAAYQAFVFAWHQGRKAGTSSAVGQPTPGDGASLSPRLKAAVDNAIYAQCGQVSTANVSRQEVFALIDAVCVGLDSPPAASASVNEAQPTGTDLLAVNRRQALMIQDLKRMLDRHSAKVQELKARTPIGVPRGYRLISETPTDALMQAGWAEGWSAYANYVHLLDAAANELAASGYTEVGLL